MTETKQAQLHDFEGREVQRATVKITNAGDGLSEALNIDPEEIELDDERFYVLSGTCSRVSIETDKNGITSRVHTIKTQRISKVDADVAGNMLAAAAEELERAKAEASGQLLFEQEQEAAEREAND